MSQSNTTALQTILRYITDSRDGYQKAAETVERPAFKRVFEARARERGVIASRIANTLRVRGQESDQDGSTLGAFHRNMMAVVSLVQSDEKAALETLDDGEERLRDKIRDVIENGDLTTSDRAMLMSVERELEADARILESMQETVD